ncbi:DUF1294 domain-containing protein [Massilia forsythiae]|uniref:DUF1294 domain-containing protein n=2 Tax=Massilia forsythiae TaxID=2728020 RepID=A0A7Z2ZV10_9BURK|nr:DUF1294 domain-containing protein [Massilia forsythiae]
MPYLPLFLFVLVYGYATLAWSLPPAAGIAYLLASVICFAAYASDKAAARRGERRTPERSLLLLGLACGWPGAVLAQQWLRHKTRKQPFRRLFLASVVVNVAAFLWLAHWLSS